jgi:hypothetical protein
MNRFQGTNSARQCSLAGRYDNPIPTPSLHRLFKNSITAPLNYSPQCTHIWAHSAPCCTATGSPNISVTMSPTPREIYGKFFLMQSDGKNAGIMPETSSHTHTPTGTVHPRTSTPSNVKANFFWRSLGTSQLSKHYKHSRQLQARSGWLEKNRDKMNIFKNTFLYASIVEMSQALSPSHSVFLSMASRLIKKSTY